MSDIATLARRIDAAADPDAYFGTLAFCLERCHGDLPVASDLADIAFGELQFDAAHKFSSTHFNVSDSIANGIRQLAHKVDDADLADKGRELDPHVTVKYGLHTNDPDDVRRIVAQLPPVAVQLGACSVFYGDEYDVLKIDVRSDGLRRLNQAISAGVKCTDTHPDYKPHITIAYVKSGLGDEYIRKFDEMVEGGQCSDLCGKVDVFSRLVFSDKERRKTEIKLGGTAQFDASFESRHPRHGDGRFRPHSNSGFAEKKGHRQKVQGWEKGVFKRAGEAEQRESPLPKTAARGAVEKALEDPELMNDLTQRARRLIGRDLQSAIDPEDVVQSAVMHGLKGADAGEFESHEDAAGWLHSHVDREARFMGRGLRAFKRRGAGGAMSLDEELDVAERTAESAGVDAAVVLGRAIAALDDDDRKVFVAYYGLDGQPPRGRDSKAIVKSRIGRIKKALRGHLAEQAMSGSRQDDPSPPPATDESGRMAEAGAGKGKAGGSLYHVRLADKLDELGRELNLSKKQLRAIKAIAAKRGAEQFDETNSVDPLPDHITSVGHRAAIGAMDAARSAIRDLLKKNDLALDSPDLFSQIERILNEAMPALSQTLAESTIAAHVRGVDDVLKLANLQLPSLPPPNVPPGTRWLFPDSEEPPIVRFPVLEFAARRIVNANVMAPDDFYRLAAGARENAFTVSGDLTQESVAKIRDALYENLREGPDANAFARDVDGLFEEGMPLSRAHLEQVFRNNVNGAWSDGHDKALQHELISDGFPYRSINATHDQRVRDEHLILEHTGLSGTNIYLADDEVFRTFRGPWSWGCRCSWGPVSISQAARKGVEHAQRWLEQAKRLGVEPEQTSIEAEHVDWPTLNGERIMPPPQWQRSVQMDDANYTPQKLHKLQGDPIERARGLGVSLEFAPNAEHSHETLHAVLDELQRLKTNFRVPVASLKKITAAGRGIYAGHYTDVRKPWRSGGEIEINARQSIAPGYVRHSPEPHLGPMAVSGSGTVAGGTIEGVTAHEIGHHVHFHLSDEDKAMWSAVLRSVGGGKLVDRAFPGSHRQPQAEAISSYATSNEREAFAEAFNAYTHPNYQRGTLHGRVERYFDNTIGKPPSHVVTGKQPAGVLPSDYFEADVQSEETWNNLRKSLKTKGGLVRFLLSPLVGAGQTASRHLRPLVRRLRGLSPKVRRQLVFNSVRSIPDGHLTSLALSQVVNKIMQRTAQFDDAGKRYVGPPGYGKKVFVQSLGHAPLIPAQAANIHDTADWMREPLRAGEDYELFKTYSRPGRFGQSFAKTGVSETAITQEHETEKFLMAIGVPVPDTRLVNVPSKHGGSRSMKVSDWLSNHQKFDRTSESHRAMIRPHLVAQALLGNEDLASTNVKVGPQGVTFIDVGDEGIGNREPANLLSGIQGYIFEHSPQEMLTPDEYRQQMKQIGERLESALQHVSDPARRERLRKRYADLMQHDGTYAPGVPYWPPGEPRPVPQSVQRPAPQWPQVRPFSEQFDAEFAVGKRNLMRQTQAGETHRFTPRTATPPRAGTSYRDPATRAKSVLAGHAQNQPHYNAAMAQHDAALEQIRQNFLREAGRTPLDAGSKLTPDMGKLLGIKPGQSSHVLHHKRDAAHKALAKHMGVSQPAAIEFQGIGDPLGQRGANYAQQFLGSVADAKHSRQVPVSDYSGRSVGSGSDAGIFISPDWRGHIKLMLHEFGHHLEKTDPAVQKLASGFLASRSDGVKPGLWEGDSITGNFGSRPYAGTIRNANGSEIVSVGIERLYDDPATFAREDPEYFKLVIGILSGRLGGR